MIAGFFMSLLRFGSTFLGQMQSCGRENNKLEIRLKPFLEEHFQDSQGIFIQQISSIKRKQEKGWEIQKLIQM